ncbi:hypothetical protein HDU76_005664 [Blyttiomyces sp. JEL0837]|nr:hypothetical protein HDU76_005664 [Blyttiomyces sp. JEL0837]
MLSGGTFMLHGVEVPFPLVEEGEGAAAKDGAAAAEEGHANKDGEVKKIKRRHSLQVADMQRRLRMMERELKAAGQDAEDDDLSPINMNSSSTLAGLDIAQPHVITEGTSTVSTANSSKQKRTAPTKSQMLTHKASKLSVAGSINTIRARSDALLKAAIAADQATKLSVFATRPAIYVPVHNFLVETLGTFMLMFGVALLEDRVTALKNPPLQAALNATLVPFLIGLYITCLVLGMGGPTGFACNPARDLAPRFAHFILPIPGKGKSEWSYGFLINVGSMLGGALSAWVYMWVKGLDQALP